MITMIMDTLLVFYYEKMVAYMPSSFADLVFEGEKIKVGLRRGKFDYAAPASTSNRRFGASGAKKKEGDTHVVTSAPTWPKSQQTPHNTYQYSPHQPSFLAHVENPPNPTPIQQRVSAQPQRPPIDSPLQLLFVHLCLKEISMGIYRKAHQIVKYLKIKMDESEYQTQGTNVSLN